MCFCEADLNKEESCKKGLKWFEYNYDIKEWDNLELFYNQYVNIECQENNRIQIEKDVDRTYPNSKLYQSSFMKDKLI